MSYSPIGSWERPPARHCDAEGCDQPAAADGELLGDAWLCSRCLEAVDRMFEELGRIEGAPGPSVAFDFEGDG